MFTGQRCLHWFRIFPMKSEGIQGEESVNRLTKAKENSLVRGWHPETNPGDEDQQGTHQVDTQLKD